MNMTPMAASVLRDSLMHAMPFEHLATIAVIKSCPEDMLTYRPHIKSMTFAAMGFHVYGSGLWFLSLVGKVPPMTKIPRVPTKTSALVKSCESMNKKFVTTVARMTPDELAAKHDFLGMGMFPAAHLLNLHLRHLIHHRGQMQLMLRLMGAKCPAVYGPSGDVTFEEMSSKRKPRAKK